MDKEQNTLLVIEVPAYFKKGGRATKLVDGQKREYGQDKQQDKTLLSYIKKALEWKAEMESKNMNIRNFAKIKKMDISTTGKILRLNYLAPDIIEKIVLGKYPSTLCARDLLRNGIPNDWEVQRKMYGF